MAINLIPFLSQPEFQSSLFLFSNSILILLTYIFIHPFPFSSLSVLIYVLITFYVTKRLASGNSYKPTKNLQEQIVIVTGAATGIGYVSATELAKLGAKVIVGIRGQERAERIAKQIAQKSNGTVIGYDLDLSNLSNVKHFAEQILKNEQRLDILLNNAGGIKDIYTTTTDGLEIQWATNHIGHFYLTKLLLSLLLKSKGRVVNVSSIVHFIASRGIDYEFFIDSYSNFKVYGTTKLANIWHAYELHRRYGSKGLKAYSLHPGSIITTEFNRNRPKLVLLLIQSLMYFFSKTIYEGTLTSLYCSLSDDAQSGKYHSDCKEAQPSQIAYNQKLAEECWNKSEEIIEEKTKYLS
ncbi:unnamed protein product [Didymodactylos carnosus]|nr:unnamed protein product [Didymodactylos carnosus]CAF3986394.1 unnamed protein product [Didymodactylos carnosus]